MAGYYYYEPYFLPPSPDLFKELDGDDSESLTLYIRVYYEWPAVSFSPLAHPPSQPRPVTDPY